MIELHVPDREKNTASEQSTQSKISSLNVCECVRGLKYLKKEHK